MATVKSMYEEKLSPTLEGCFTKKENESEKLNNTRIDDEGEEGKTDAVLDEIAAKVNALDFRKDDNDDQDNHLKCMDTVRKQGETINTLVNQLRIMFDEYTEMHSEREYYEELNSALLRCLEIMEGKLQVEDDSDDELEGQSKTRIIIKSPDHDDAMETTASETNNTEATDTGMAQKDSDDNNAEKMTGEKGNTENSRTTDRNKVKSSELKRLNRILLREIFELRHQIETLKENFREYLQTEDLSQSEYDTATDDDHACLHCVPGKHDEDTESEYENQEQEASKIADESDSD